CRFDYPMECQAEAGVGYDSKNRVRFEPARNDPLLNTYNPAMILAWRANIDVKPVMSTDAARNYIAKYASKAEQQAPAFPELLSGIMLDEEEVTWAELWAQCRAVEHEHPKDTLRCWEDENRNLQEEEDDDEEVPNPDAASNEDDWQAEQREILDSFGITYADILAGLRAPQSLFQVDGSAGCGKTYMIHAICQELRAMAEQQGEMNPVQGQLSPAERDSFKDAICLYTTREDVQTINLAELQDLNQPCARVQARHDGGSGGHKVSADEAGGLENHTYLAKGAKVMITRNLWADKGV
ncbi:hypothetical protein C8R44DRAFT_556634, partial [Mycena epipterygia]